MSQSGYPLTWVDVCFSVSKIHERRELKINLAFQHTLNGTSFHRPRNQSLKLNEYVSSPLQCRSHSRLAANRGPRPASQGLRGMKVNSLFERLEMGRHSTRSHLESVRWTGKPRFREILNGGWGIVATDTTCHIPLELPFLSLGCFRLQMPPVNRDVFEAIGVVLRTPLVR